MFCAVLMVAAFLVGPVRPLEVFWNVPTEECPSDIKFNLSQYGIIQNEGDRFLGGRFNTLYRPGLWPQAYENGTEVNGGIPPRGSLGRHLRKLRSDVRQLISENYTGPAVIDFEQWMPTLRSTGILRYRRLARNYFLRQHYLDGQTRSARLLTNDTAETLFERTSRAFLEETLRVARQERPNALWGYYHYPYCKNYLPDVEHCAAPISEDNTRAQWLYNGSAALYPSVYLRRDWSAWTNCVQTRVILEETERLAAAAGGRPIYPFTWYNYHKAPITYYMSPADLLATIGQVVTRQPAGLIIWGGSNSVATPELCRSLQRYVHGRLGPFVRFMTQLSAKRLKQIRKHLAAGALSFYSQVAVLKKEGAFGSWRPVQQESGSWLGTGGQWMTETTTEQSDWTELELERDGLIMKK